MLIRKLLGGLGLIGLVLWLAACERAVAPTEIPPRPVRTQIIQPQTIDLVGAFPGEIRAAVESPLAFRVAGKVVERRVQAGDSVQAGQILARLDDQDLRLASAAAEAQLTSAQIERNRTAADLERFRRLRDSGFISSAEYDTRQAAHAAAQAAVNQAQAHLSAQHNQAHYSQLVADADGIVTWVDVEAGQVVSAGQPVVRLARSEQREVAFHVPESLIDTVRQIGSASVDLWSGPSGLPARLTEVAGRADSSSRAFAARVALLDPPESVRLGMSATVRFQQPLAQPLIPVPLAALWRRDDQTYVWLYDPASGLVHAEAVQVVTVTDTQALLRADLPSEAEVVTAGVHRLSEGQRVRRIEAVRANVDVQVDGAMLPLTQPRRPQP